MLGSYRAILCAASGRCTKANVRLHQISTVRCPHAARLAVASRRTESLDFCKAAGGDSTGNRSGLQKSPQPCLNAPPRPSHALLVGLAITVIAASSCRVPAAAADMPAAGASCQEQQHPTQVTPDLKGAFERSSEVPRSPQLPTPPAPPLAPLPSPQQPHPPLIPSPMPPDQPPQLVPPCSPEAPPVRLIPNTPGGPTGGDTVGLSEGRPRRLMRGNKQQQPVLAASPGAAKDLNDGKISRSRLLPLLARHAQQQMLQHQWQQMLLWSAFVEDGGSSWLAAQEAPALRVPGDLPLMGTTAIAAGYEGQLTQHTLAADYSSSTLTPGGSSSGSSTAVDAATGSLQARMFGGSSAAQQLLMLAELSPSDNLSGTAVAMAVPSPPVMKLTHDKMPAGTTSAAASSQQQRQMLLPITAGLQDSVELASPAAELYDSVVGQKKGAAMEAGKRLMHSRSDDLAETLSAVGGSEQQTPGGRGSPAAAPTAADGASQGPQEQGSNDAIKSFQFVDTATQERLQADVESFTTASVRFGQALGKFFLLLFELVLKLATFVVKVTVKLLVWLLDQAKQAQGARVQQVRQQRTQLLAAPAALWSPESQLIQPLQVALLAAPHSSASCL